MYGWLRAWLPGWAAGLVTALWYALLILTTVWFASGVPEAEFRYGNL